MEINYVKSVNSNDETVLGSIYNDKLIGSLRFKILKDCIWLYNIKVDKEFRHLKNEHIGTNLLKIFENLCRNRSMRIEGKYYPEGESHEVVKGFYNKNDYIVEKDGYDWMVYKSRPKFYNLNFEVKEIDFSEYDKLNCDSGEKE